MAMTIHCDIVSAEEEIFSGRVTMVSATGTIGELGIMPGHAPLLTGIRPGPDRLTMYGGEEEEFFAICHRFLAHDQPIPDTPPVDSKRFCGFGELLEAPDRTPPAGPGS